MNINKIIIAALCVIVTLTAIFYFSSQSNMESSKYSTAINGAVNKAEEVIKPKASVVKNNSNKKEENNKKSNHITLIRKTAHIVLYSVLGFFVTMFVTCVGMKRYVYVVMALCIGVGIIDEINQSFYKFRGSSITDVLIDTVGIIIGMSIFILCKKIRQKRIENND